MKSVPQILRKTSRRLVRDKVREVLQPGEIMPLVEHEVQSILYNSLNQALLEEQEKAIGRKSYERASDPVYRNGFKDTHVPGLFGGFLRLRRPVLRRGGFSSPLLHAFKRAGSALIALLGVKSWMHGNSTRNAAGDLNAVFGTSLTPTDISTFSDHLLPAAEAWRDRKLPSDILYLFLDALYLPVRRPGFTSKQALLAALGIDSKGYRHVLGFIIGDRESTDSWSALITDLLSRGFDRSRLKLVVSDAHGGIINAVADKLGSPHQLCLVHLLRNTRHRIPDRDRTAYLDDFKAIFWADSRQDALLALGRFEERWLKAYPRVTRRIIDNAESFMVFFNEPKALHSTLRSSNQIERFIREIRRRFRPAGTMHSENEILKLFWAVAVQQEKRWERKRVHGAKALAANIQAA